MTKGHETKPKISFGLIFWLGFTKEEKERAKRKKRRKKKEKEKSKNQVCLCLVTMGNWILKPW